MSFLGEKVHIRLLFILLSFFLFFPFYAQSETFYQISDVSYELDKTREKDLKRVVLLDTERIFKSRQELESYLQDLHQRLMNTRAFQEVKIISPLENSNEENHAGLFETENLNEEETSLYSETSPDEIKKISLKISAQDSKHLLILPYPKYDSNSGFIFKIKVKDVNFLGTMNTLDFGLFAGLKEDTSSSEQNLTFGGEFNYRYPFYAGPFVCSWNNSFNLEYTCGIRELEFHTGTGLTFSLPFKRFSFVLDVSEKINRDLEYETYNDATHFTSDLNLSMPVKITEIENWGFVYWTPYVDGKASYDKDGINIKNDDLASPVLSMGQAISTTRINWYGNFRSGLSAKIGHSLGYDFKQDETEPRLFGEIQAFKSFSYVGINTRLTAFLTKSNRGMVGNLIRGVRDKQKYVNYDGKEIGTTRALKSSSAIVLNIDIPIHLITTRWLDWSDAIFGEDSWFSRTFAWTDKFNFELQASPFVDIALTKNEVTGRLFDLRDGWYTGGIEFLVFPERWKGIVMRASLGIDLGRTIIAKNYPSKIDMSWRENVKKYEIYAGIGLHY